ncbi:MAG TPA: enoyl-CoA hydratase/isomerase family protein [Acidobacteriota bacterium]|nr:enoyl-CoA hydratase/isomerase family protein [Acidobacteriota bacterium]
MTLGTEGQLLHVGLRTRNNTLSRSLIQELSHALDQHSREASSRVMIISGQGEKFFSPGFDLTEVSSFGRTQMDAMIEDFEALAVALLRHPKPIVAQINGDCLAGGCILASCCDFRLIRQEARIGMTPMSYSVAVPYTAHQVFLHLMGASRARSALWLGESYSAGQALEIGWVDQVASADDLQSSCRELALRLAEADPVAFSTSKAFLLEPLLSRVDPPSSRRRKAFLDCWFSSGSQSRLRATMERLRSKAT